MIIKGRGDDQAMLVSKLDGDGHSRHDEPPARELARGNHADFEMSFFENNVVQW